MIFSKVTMAQWKFGFRHRNCGMVGSRRFTFHSVDLILVSKELVAQDTNYHTFIDVLHVP